MKSLLFSCFCVLVSFAPASASVLTFDSITSTNNFNGVTIQGFNLVSGRAGVYDGTSGNGTFWGAAYTPDNVMTNFGSRVGEITRSTAFTFNGAYFHRDNRDADTVVNFAGLDAADNVLFTKSATVTDDWTYIDFNWAGINKFTWDPVTPDSISNVGIDNFTYDEFSSVPEPTSIATWLLVCAGGLGFAVKRRVHRHR